MSIFKHHHVFSILFLFLALSSSKFTNPTVAQNLDDQNHGKQTYIVRVDNDLKPSHFSDVEEWYKSIYTNLNNISPNYDPNPFHYIYKTVFHGFSARLTPEQVEALEAHSSVMGVFPDQTYELHTTRTPHFLGLDSYQSPTGLIKDSKMGSDVVIGIIDTGIWPEDPSFHDGGLGPVPAQFKGVCEGGKDFPSSLCNKKLVGVRYFTGGRGDDSARDDVGHGTHTGSTAAGRPLLHSSFFGYATGEAKGIATKARLAVYKVCLPFGCMASAVLAGIDKAVEDGVDIISLSLGGGPTRYHVDPIAIGSYGAIQKGVFFSASAGNAGPYNQSVANIAPWITTVGASTIDRAFPVDLILGNGDVLTGTSLYTDKRFAEDKYFPIVHDVNGSSSGKLCMKDGLASETVKGKIVICLAGMISNPAKGVNVRKAGGIGVVVVNDELSGEALYSDPYFGIPGLTITYSSREKLFNYYKTSPQDAKVRMVFRGTKIPSGRAPSVAGFSSRGPNPESIYVLKPDVIAPGVDILASWPDTIPPSRIPEDPRRSPFNILSGTSMSCPHVAGVAALLKGAHKEWTPAMIRSAMMTTAYNTCHDGKPILAQENNLPASIWLRGAGHVDPEKANDPGLVFNLTEDDYIDFLCASNYTKDEIKMIARKEVSCEKRTKKEWDLNYPAIVVVTTQQVGTPSKLNITVTRTATNVGSNSSSYQAEIVSPKGAKVSVNPSELKFEAIGEKKSFEVQVLAEKDKDEVMGAEEGLLTWTDGKHRVNIPLVVVDTV